MPPDTMATDWARLSERIAEAVGLHFPRERWPDLQRGLAEAARELGYSDCDACVESLLAAPLTKAQVQVLAHHLTIGETYFFREKKTFEILGTQVLPALIESRRRGGRQLRFWSAACCTGEEAYSLAILLHQLLPDLQEWQVTILATDINEHFLQKAVAGAYGEWSFRDTPAGFKERYFTRGDDGRYLVVPEIRQLVTFAPLNLAETSYAGSAADTNAMDVIFCRNVLMYFSPTQAGRAINNLRHALVEGGWLAVGPSEVSQVHFQGLATRNFPGVILYQKSNESPSLAPSLRHIPRVDSRRATSGLSWRPADSPTKPAPASPSRTARDEPRPTSHEAALSLYAQGRYADAIAMLLMGQARAICEIHLLARALANQGKLSDALAWCDRAIAHDKVDPTGHYLRATVLLEQGHAAEARNSFQRTVYLDPTFVLAHFALGNLARASARPEEADRHFNNARQLLADLPAEGALLEADGLTVGRLAEIISSLTTVKARP